MFGRSPTPKPRRCVSSFVSRVRPFQTPGCFPRTSSTPFVALTAVDHQERRVSCARPASRYWSPTAITPPSWSARPMRSRSSCTRRCRYDCDVTNEMAALTSIRTPPTKQIRAAVPIPTIKRMTPIIIAPAASTPRRTPSRHGVHPPRIHAWFASSHSISYLPLRLGLDSQGHERGRRSHHASAHAHRSFAAAHSPVSIRPSA
jgi:hypothetical protein